MDRTVLVTGCSSGIGRATALRFRDAGWVVYATARDPDDVADLRERGCRTVELDVTDDLEVAAAVDRIVDETGRIDCLVNNAGYGQFGAVEDVPMEKTVEQFDVNAFGPLRLVHAVLPRMRERGLGTVINVTAGVGGITLPGIGVYNASKRALETASDALRQEVSGEGVDVVVVQPGFVATEFYDRALAEIDAIDRAPAYADLYRALDRIGIVEGGGPGINSPERVAETILTAAEADRPKSVYRTGPLATAVTLLGGAVRGRARDALTRTAVGVLASGPAQRLLGWVEERRGVRRPHEGDAEGGRKREETRR